MTALATFSGGEIGDGMANFSHWDFLDKFGYSEAEALIAGIDPTAVGDGDNWRRIYSIHLRVEQGFSLAIENYPGVQPPEALLCMSMQSSAISGKPSQDIALAKFHRDELALKSKTPMQAMKNWYHEHPHLFHKRPYDRPGCDIYRGKFESSSAPK
ncbi:hypothetical protein [Simplicispira psychrophila]|uniref:hypothetical protein n=1 Tax=Simplicispira psychrophila TaxID=80882 RepID=UPI0012EC976F|nr:hypothetical protein [Simplicispira psychrophila]